MKPSLTTLSLSITLAAVPFGCPAGTVDFAEYDGVYTDNNAVPVDLAPLGLPEGITARWTGWALTPGPGTPP